MQIILRGLGRGLRTRGLLKGSRKRCRIGKVSSRAVVELVVKLLIINIQYLQAQGFGLEKLR